MAKPSMVASPDVPRASMGIPGLDDVLCGGLPRSHTYLVQGDPGVGKTTLALQFLIEGAAQGERTLYVSLSESRHELLTVASSHGWNLDKIELYELSALDQLTQSEADNTVFHPAEIELREVTRQLLEQVEKIGPRRVVFDSLSEIRLLAMTPVAYRRQIMQLKHHFSGRETTVLLLDDRTGPENDQQLQSLAHGVIELQQLPQGYGAERRRLRIAKLRGLKFRGGYHDFKVQTGGLEVYPRLVAAEHTRDVSRAPLPSGLPHLDKLLGGGLDPGTSTLIMGPAGTGKSSVMIHYAVAAAKQGMRALVLAFDEGRATLLRRAEAMGLNLKAHLDDGSLVVRQVDPAEMAPDELANAIRKAVETENCGFVAIDSLNGYLHAMPDERFLNLQLHELLAYLSHKGVVAVLVMAQQGVVGQAINSPIEVSYVADTIVLLRFYETAGEVRKAISVVKKRSGPHEKTIRELTIGDRGLQVSEPLKGLKGVLSGLPDVSAAPVVVGA